METVTKPVTADELLRMAERSARLELVRGVVVERHFASWSAATAATELNRALADYVEPRELGELLGPVGYHLRRDPDTVRAPSISFVAEERMQRLHAQMTDAASYIPGAPDLAVEITCVWDGST